VTNTEPQCHATQLQRAAAGAAARHPERGHGGEGGRRERGRRQGARRLSRASGLRPLWPVRPAIAKALGAGAGAAHSTIAPGAARRRRQGLAAQAEATPAAGCGCGGRWQERESGGGAHRLGARGPRPPHPRTLGANAEPPRRATQFKCGPAGAVARCPGARGAKGSFGGLGRSPAAK
jgi:hypothetical protein